MKTEIIKSDRIAKMKFVVQCYISDVKGAVVRISEYSFEQLEAAYIQACKFYNGVLPVPDNGHYEDYTEIL